MDIISRKDAKKLGLTRYFTGKKCPKGHNSERRVHNGGCCCCETEYSRKYELENKESRNKKCRDYTRLNKDERVKYNRDWRRSNPDIAGPMVRAAAARRRARILMSEGSHSKKDINNIMMAQNKKCAFCSKSLLKGGYHVDHVVPLAKNGTNWPDNLQILCPSCNMSKGAKDPYEWAQENGRLL